MTKFACAFLVFSSLVTLVAPSALLHSEERLRTITPASRLRGAASSRRSLDWLNASTIVPPLTPVGAATPIKFLISAFQDGERCANTLYQALAKAEHPERISFNVLQAVGSKDVRCNEEFRQKRAPELCRAWGKDASSCLNDVLARVNFRAIKLEEGEGPVHQRGLLSEFADLDGDGAMCLATDSHMGFAGAWDRDLLQDWADAKNEFAVMSAYPFSTDGLDSAGTDSWIELCGYFLTQQGIPRGATARPMAEAEGRKTGAPQLTMNWAAGQSFGRCHAERNVPVDKNLAWMFDGEEVGRAVRFWTSGYDLYNPRVNVVLHNYSHAEQKFWSYSKVGMPEKKAASEARLRNLLQGRASREEYGKYGLGDQRSLEEYVTWAKTDLGGRWRKFLERKGLTAHYSDYVPGGSTQPMSVPGFCDHLQRAPVRDAQALLRSAGVSQ